MSNNINSNTTAAPPSGDLLMMQQQAVNMTAVICVKMLLASAMIATAGTLVYVTICSKNLHGPCNLLICANCACIVLYSPTFFIQFMAIILSGPSGFSARLCVLLQAIPKLGNYGQYVFFLLIAVDRLLSVLFPIWSANLHTQRRQRRYLTLLFSLGFGYGMTVAGLSIYSTYTQPDKIVVCETGVNAEQIFSDLGMVLSICACAAYVLLWVMFRLRKFNGAPPASNDYTARLLNCLMVMFLLEFCGWSANQIATKVLNRMGPSQLQRWFIKSYVGWATQTMLAMYAPTLFIMRSFSILLEYVLISYAKFSSEYRKALRQTFGCIPQTRVTAIKSNEIQMSRNWNGRSTR